MFIRTSVMALILCLGAEARVLRIEVTDRSDVLAGRSFGKTGAYEKIRGKVYFAVDPKDKANERITDLDKAPKNGQGQVEYSSDLYILKPRHLSQGNGTILFEPPNRGGKGMLVMFNRTASALNPETAEHFGDGLLMDAGYTLVWLGWQHDVPRRPGLMRVTVPTVQGIKGLVRSEFVPEKPVSTFSLGDSGHVPYVATSPATATLTVRDGIRGARETIDRDSWKIENGTDVVLSKPALPGRIYEVIYESANPPVAGLGLAAVRDLISHLKYGSEPLIGDQHPLKHAIGFGVSQSAMLLKAIVYEGFNVDEKGKQVFDGVFAHVAGGRRSTFQRFTQPSRTAGPLRNASFSPTDQFPFADPLTAGLDGIKDGVLARAMQSGTVPKIFYTNSTYEYWGSVGALVHVSVDGKQDVKLPATTRVYLLAGGQHGPAAFPPGESKGQNLSNFNDYKWILRALLEKLQLWVAQGKEPPSSSYPTLQAKTLVSRADYVFPAIRNIELPRSPHLSEQLDFGPAYRSRGIVEFEPPRLGKRYAALIPQADRDGNDRTGVKMPAVTVPLGTFTGWNLRGTAIGATNELLGQNGSYIPFARTKAERQQQGDPRPSIEERYTSQNDYLEKINAAAKTLAASGYLLERDIPAVIAMAKRHWTWALQQETTKLTTNGSR